MLSDVHLTVTDSVVDGTLVLCGWIGTFGTAGRKLGSELPVQTLPRCTNCNNQAIKGQCTNRK